TVGENYNFTELSPALISGSVYADVNNNGIKEIGEATVVGVLLTLTGTNDQGAIVPITVSTNAAGIYSFGGLRPGTYTVTETQPVGYLDALDAKGTAIIPNSNTTDVIDSLTVTSGGSAADNKLGELLPGSVSGSVYIDAKDNGIKDSAE